MANPKIPLSKPGDTVFSVTNQAQVNRYINNTLVPSLTPEQADAQKNNLGPKDTAIENSDNKTENNNKKVNDDQPEYRALKP